MSDLDIESAHDRFTNNVLLILRHRLVVNRFAAAFAPLRQRYSYLLIDMIGNGTVRLLSVLRPALATRSLRLLFALTSGEWGRLTLLSPQCFFKFSSQSLVFGDQLFILFSKRIDFPDEVFNCWRLV